MAAMTSNANHPFINLKLYSAIFLKRKPNELRINSYNAACRANMDIQFVLDVYMHVQYTLCHTYPKLKKVLRTHGLQ